MKVRIIYNKDGSIGVVHPAPKCKKSYEEIVAKATPEGVEFEDVDKSEIPEDRSQRNFWTGRKGEGISIGDIEDSKPKSL